MTDSIAASTSEAVTYTSHTRQRAERAAKCSPFRLKLFKTLKTQSVALQDLIDDAGIHNGYTRLPIGELAAENELLWLLAVGLLRREVDGQGLTDSFRLTPLGRQLLKQWSQSTPPTRSETKASGETTDLKPRFQDHLYNALSRWLRLPGWLQS